MKKITKLMGLIFITSLLLGVLALTIAATDNGTVQARWGTSADSLTFEGTLEEALNAAENDLSVKYIRLSSDVENEDTLFIVESGDFTLDLAGHTVISDGYTLDFRGA